MYNECGIFGSPTHILVCHWMHSLTIQHKVSDHSLMKDLLNYPKSVEKGIDLILYFVSLQQYDHVIIM